jgi:TolB-like protein/DNA-binding winged helix-turn-helix (wHTH) protein/Tfp pilus assembly protein PilF
LFSGRCHSRTENVFEEFCRISWEILPAGVRLNTNEIYRFGAYSLDARERVLLRDGKPVTLPPKDLETLLVLVESAGHIVEKEDLLKRVWPGVFIEEGNLSRRIFNLRQILGEGPDGRAFIETIPKRGYRFSSAPADLPTPPSAPAENPVVSNGPGHKRIAWLWPVALSAVLVVIAILVSRHVWSQHTDGKARLMLAVLPFQNMSGDSHEDYFAEGLTEEMIAQLGQLQPRQLGLIARTSIVRYKDTKESASQIGKELGVGYLLEGSVRRGGERVRITAQLIRTSDQTHLWSETYERPLTDFLDIQREIAEKVTHSLSLQLLPANTANYNSLNVQSYDKYLLGRHDLRQGTAESIEKSIEHFQDAIAENPRDARFYAALGEAHEALTTYYSSPKQQMPEVKSAAMQALQLDPNLANAHVLLGDVHLLFDWDWAAAEKEYNRALEINPSLPEAQLGFATYLGTLGRFDEALSHVEQAYVSDPLAIDTRNDALWIYYFSGRMKDTVEQAQKAIELEPSSGLPYALLAMAYARMGEKAQTIEMAEKARTLSNSPSIMSTTASALAQVGQEKQARSLLKQAIENSRNHYLCRFLVATTYSELGDKEQTLQSLEEGYLQRST